MDALIRYTDCSTCFECWGTLGRWFLVTTLNNPKKFPLHRYCQPFIISTIKREKSVSKVSLLRFVCLSLHFRPLRGPWADNRSSIRNRFCCAISESEADQIRALLSGVQSSEIAPTGKPNGIESKRQARPFSAIC